MVGRNLYFEPDEAVTGAEFIAMVACACKLEADLSTSTLFADDTAIPSGSASM
jgi:hypothetical protein